MPPAPLSAREKDWIRRRCEPALPAHAIDLAAKLLEGAPAAEQLDDFTWSVAGGDEQQVVLSAIPVDETARLFCQEFRLALHRTTFELRRLEAHTRQGRWQVIERPTLTGVGANSDARVVGTIVLTAVTVTPDDPGLPPSPQPDAGAVIRFAGGEIDLEAPTPR